MEVIEPGHVYLVNNVGKGTQKIQFIQRRGWDALKLYESRAARRTSRSFRCLSGLQLALSVATYYAFALPRCRGSAGILMTGTVDGATPFQTMERALIAVEARK